MAILLIPVYAIKSRTVQRSTTGSAPPFPSLPRSLLLLPFLLFSFPPFLASRLFQLSAPSLQWSNKPSAAPAMPGAQGPKTVTGGQSDPNYVSRLVLRLCTGISQNHHPCLLTSPFRTGRYLLFRKVLATVANVCRGSKIIVTPLLPSFPLPSLPSFSLPLSSLFVSFPLFP